MIKYEFHELAKSLPLMWGSEWTEFVEDIRKNGQLLPIGIFEGRILDGRNRYRACQELGIEGKFEKVSPRDAKAYVTSINVHRRQLTKEQKQHYLTLLIVKQDSLGMTNSEVAKAADVSEKTVEAKKTENKKKSLKDGVFKGNIPEKSNNIKGKTNEPKNGTTIGKITDDSGRVVPDASLPYWNRKPEANNVLNQIRAAKGQVKKLLPNDPMWSEVNLNGVLGDLESAINRFKAAIPAYVCPYCKGVKPAGCKSCKGRGVISKFLWSMMPEEMRK